ncbi:hypothetical protein F4X86_03765 [Candidatus Saccharibacteria bacterium]|nr:hypothetical protein [Candidatus Saccharibacteria bacterium]
MLKLFLRLSLAAACLPLSALVVALGLSQPASAATTTSISDLEESQQADQVTFLVEVTNPEARVQNVNYYVSPVSGHECGQAEVSYDLVAGETAAGRRLVRLEADSKQVCLRITHRVGSETDLLVDFHGFAVNPVGSVASQPAPATGTSASINSSDVCGGSGRYLLGIPSWDRGLGDCDRITSEELLGGEKARLIALNIMAILTHVAAFVAIGFVIFGGFQYVLSTGNADQATNARKTIINAGIGAVIVIMARVLVEVIYNNLTGG